MDSGHRFDLELLRETATKLGTAEAELVKVRAERDALAAQVAALVGSIQEAANRRHDAFDPINVSDLLANIPAAAARYLAAHKACNAIDKDLRAGAIPAFDLGDSEASRGMYKWRKAAGK
jgi:hypothetical protein